ncbi:MAG: hypothetical protein JNG86_19515 [Verrucomicrobiaceae bacterium]|nr:hypothetical protein [Verrucomicrobiaceae bacterium]
MKSKYHSSFAAALLGLLHSSLLFNHLLAQEAPAPEPRVLYSHTVRKADGGLLTFERIEAAVAAPAAQPAPVVTLPVFSAGAEIYVDATGAVLSEVTWRHEGRRYKARSSVDFRLLTGTGAFGEGAARWSLMLAMSVESRARFEAESARHTAAGLPEQTWPVFAPELLASVPAGMRAWFVVVESEGTAAQQTAACVAMEALHAHMEAHWDTLHAARAQRETEAAALAAWKAAHPEPLVKDTVIRYWPGTAAATIPNTGEGAP